MLRVMMAAAALAVIAPTMAAGTTLQLPPEGKPVATITIPDTWTHKVDDGDHEAASEDDLINISVGLDKKLLAEAEIVKEVTKEAGDVQVVPGTIKSANDQVNGMKAVVTHMDVKTKNGAARMTFAITQIVTPNPDVFVHVILVNLSGSKEHEAELDAMFASLKMVD